MRFWLGCSLVSCTIIQQAFNFENKRFPTSEIPLPSHLPPACRPSTVRGSQTPFPVPPMMPASRVARREQTSLVRSNIKSQATYIVIKIDSKILRSKPDKNSIKFQNSEGKQLNSRTCWSSSRRRRSSSSNSSISFCSESLFELRPGFVGGECC